MSVRVAPAECELPQRVSGRWVWLYSLASFGYAAVNWGASSVLTPELADRVGGPDKVIVLGLITGTWSAVGLVCAPLIGTWSDRTRSRRGRRHPWILVGTLGTAATLVAMSVQTGLLGLLVLAPLNALFPLMASTGLGAVVPDEVPVEQRATVSAWAKGVAGPAGLLAGTALVSSVVTGLSSGLLVTAVLLVALTIPFVLLTRGTPAVAGERWCGRWWALLRGQPDFGWALGGQFCVHLASGLTMLFLYYFLTDVVRHADPAVGLLVLTVIYAVVAAVTCVPIGRISDRLRCRKKITMAGAACQCLACSVLALWQTWPAALVTAVLLGCACGIGSAAGNALIMDLLPDAAARAKDLGVLSVMGSAAGVLASLIATPVITHFGYPMLYSVAAVLAAAAVVLINRIKSVR